MRAGQQTEPNSRPADSGAGRRILIDALAARFGGTAYAVIQLARCLARRPGVSMVIVVTRRGSIVEAGAAEEAGVRCMVLPAASRIELIRRTAWEATRLPALVAREECDVVISMSGMLPRSPDYRLMCLLFNPVMYENRTPANLLRRWAVRRTAREAEYLAAPSRSMADLASASIGRECAVIPLGVDHSVFSPSTDGGKEILCVADFYAHKRHDLILDAWLRLRSPRPRLRLVGNSSVDPRTYARLLARIELLPEADSIILEHRIPLERLVNAYHRARVFVMASERESFCMPLVESMACGVPVVARGLRSLRETSGEGARYVDGDDPDQWAEVLGRLIEDDVEHERARRAAVASAARFSWEAFAADIVDRF
jgi:glycosyltransferase involved in cell wall biosynthesis